MTLNIVLVEPQIPQNTGNIARTCSVTGARLHLVGPMGFKVDDRKLKRAGLDYWHMLDITFYDDLPSFFHTVSDGVLSLNDEAPDTSDYEFHYFETHSPYIYTEPNYKDNAFIFFGSETKGLKESLIKRNHKQCVQFPQLTGTRSLNLSNAVAIGVYEVLRQWGFPKMESTRELGIENGERSVEH
ncbi:MAG: tRNA (cytidine(34)-2'-O)-methyltransferase [Oscillospiraceae bacterium]|nr:tRNA (cytidine(34)-2'-O)-methyltransferase [Oscillospiraceae bacterium]